MRTWLRRLLRRYPIPDQRPPVISMVRVACDDKDIVITEGDRAPASVAWADIANVSVKTTDAGPFDIDLFWVLGDRSGRPMALVPMGAVGEGDLLRAMQARLPGFDNMAVVEAMSSVDNGTFQIWPPAADLG